MIRLTGRQQFEGVAARAGKERMSVRRSEPNVCEVTNRAESHSYLVRFLRRGANIFGKCTCEAGTPCTNRVPQVCKHLFVAVITAPSWG